METVAAITIMVPVLLPVAVTLGVDPVHFGVIMVLNLMIGLLTPPVGMVLYVLARVANIPFERLPSSGTAPFLIPLLIVPASGHLRARDLPCGCPRCSTADGPRRPDGCPPWRSRRPPRRDAAAPAGHSGWPQRLPLAT
jgi:hypothetical protein